MAQLKYQRLWITCGIGFVLLVIYLSLTSEPPDFGVPQAFDIGHALAYFWLMIWFAQIYRTLSHRLGFAAAFGALGIALEYVQGMTGYRAFEYSDMALDILGVGIGLALAHTKLQNALAAVEHALMRR